MFALLCPPGQYPSWLAEHAPQLPQDELRRFEEQSRLVTELVRVYETSPEDGGRVMELMQRMQACGTPPQEILVRFFSVERFFVSVFHPFGIPRSVPCGFAEWNSRNAARCRVCTSAEGAVAGA